MAGKVEEIAECCICTDLLTDPRVLPCIHTFCLKCLNEISVNARLNPGDLMPCPLCRTSFVIPTEGMVGLQRNFFMERLVEIAKISRPSEMSILCELCVGDVERNSAELSNATHYCIECHQHICNGCIREHKRNKLLKEHQLVLMGSRLKEELVRKSSIQYCDKHNSKEVELYCLNCKEVICVICFAAKHKSHECPEMKVVGEGFREVIASNLRQTKNLSKEASQKFQNLVETREDFRSVLENVEKAIIKRRDELKEFVDKCTVELLDELASFRQQRLKQLEFEKEESERHKVSLESFENYLTELISKGSAAEICRSFHDLNSRSNDLQKSHCHHIQKQVPSVHISFETTALENVLKAKNIVGHFKGDSSYEKFCSDRFEEIEYCSAHKRTHPTDKNRYGVYSLQLPSICAGLHINKVDKASSQPNENPLTPDSPNKPITGPKTPTERK